MKRLFRILFSVVFLVILFFTFSAIKNNSYAACSTDRGDSCTSNPCCTANNLYCNRTSPDPLDWYCACDSTSYLDGNICRNKKTYNESCTADIQCDSTKGLSCEITAASTPTHDVYACLCGSGKAWNKSTGLCDPALCTRAKLCEGKCLEILSIACGGIRETCDDCTGSYKCDLSTHTCQVPTCNSYAPDGGSAECLTATQCHQEHLSNPAIVAKSPSDCSGTRPTCCVYPANINRGGFDCTMYGCSSHTGPGAGVYDSAASCRADHCNGGGTNCAVCPAGFTFDITATKESNKCYRITTPDRPNSVVAPKYEQCTADQCVQGNGCSSPPGEGFKDGRLPCGSIQKTVNGVTKYVTTCPTAFGSISTNPQELVKNIFGIILSISGGLAALLIIFSAYKLITSQGNPEKVKAAQEQLTAAIVGLVMIIFTFTFMNFIGVDILNIFKQ